MDDSSAEEPSSPEDRSKRDSDRDRRPEEESDSEGDEASDLPAEVYAQEYKAKKRVNELKQMRQFFKKEGNQGDKARAWIKEQQKKEPCFICGRLGHWPKECPMKQSGGSKNSHAVHVTAGPSVGSPEQWSLLESW